MKIEINRKQVEREIEYLERRLRDLGDEKEIINLSILYHKELLKNLENKKEVKK